MSVRVTLTKSEILCLIQALNDVIVERSETQMDDEYAQTISDYTKLVDGKLARALARAYSQEQKR